MINIQEQITESLDVIYAYSIKKCRDRYEAEDLAQEIIVTLLQSACKLKEPEKFYGWMWGVASNVYKSHVRKNIKHQTSCIDDYRFLSDASTEADYVDTENKRRLFKELSRLSGVYRQVTKLYYMDGKSCDKISDQLNISLGMVKQYLFQSRKKLKEGMDMFKESGEVSFNPRAFKLNFWGTEVNHRSSLFKRKLPGNILLEAYYDAKSIEELSSEMGVSAVYLEDEIEILMDNQLMISPVRNKFQSNMIILTHAFLDEAMTQTASIYQKITDDMISCISSHKSLRKHLSFEFRNDNEFNWQMVSYILLGSMKSNALHSRLDNYPQIQGDEQGYMWGLEQKHNDINKGFGIYTYDLDNGYDIFGLDFSSYSHKNQSLFKKEEIDSMIKMLNGENDKSSTGFINLQGLNLVVNEKLNVPVYSKESVRLLDESFESIVSTINKESVKIYEVVKKILKNHIPKSMRHQLDDVSALTVANDMFFIVLENSISRQLIQEEENRLCCLSTFIIRR